MALLGIEEGIQAFAAPNLFGNNVETTFKLHLYTNNHVPAAADVWTPLGTDYVECTDASYAAVTLSYATWTFSSIAGPICQAAYPVITFTFASTSVTLYGYVITDSGNTKAIIAEEFTGAPLTGGSALPLYLTLLITLS